MNLATWIDRIPSPYHASALIKEVFQQEFKADHHRLEITDLGDGALAVWVLPKSKPKEFRFALAHTDSPTLRLKSNAVSSAAGLAKLNVEIYGGPLYNSWLDRDLGLAGQVAYECDGKIVKQAVQLPLGLRVPQLAVHLDRGVNSEGLKLNAQTQLSPVLGLDGADFNQYLLGLNPVAQSVLGFDLLAYDLQKSAVGGLGGEFLYAGRLDNLASCHSLVYGLLGADLVDGVAYAVVFFHHEEVGSESQVGARSLGLERIFAQILESHDLTVSEQNAVRTRSMAFSMDMAHGLHPNYPEKHDPHNHPICGQGPVLKSNASLRYATDLRAAATLRLIAKEKGIPLQDFHSRNDVGCGSTVGPGFAALLGVCTADLGAPMLSMHSAREMLVHRDHTSTTQLLSAFFSRPELP